MSKLVTEPRGWSQNGGQIVPLAGELTRCRNSALDAGCRCGLRACPLAELQPAAGHVHRPWQLRAPLPV